MKKKYRRLQGTGHGVTAKGQVGDPVFFFFNSLGGRQGLWEAEEDGRVEGGGLLCVTGIIGYFCFTMLMWE